MGQSVTLLTERATGRNSQDAAREIERPPHYTLCKIIIDDNDNLISLRLPHYQVYVRGITSPACKYKSSFSLEKQVKVKNEETNTHNFIRLELFGPKRLQIFFKLGYFLLFWTIYKHQTLRMTTPPPTPALCNPLSS